MNKIEEIIHTVSPPFESQQRFLSFIVGVERVLAQKKVLVAGINGKENQFTRALDKLGLAYEMYRTGQSKVPILDAVILSTVHISHEEHARVRAAYKDAGKRIFPAGISSSAVHYDICTWIMEEAGIVVEPGEECMSQEVIEQILTVRNALSGLTGEIKELRGEVATLKKDFEDYVVSGDTVANMFKEYMDGKDSLGSEIRGLMKVVGTVEVMNRRISAAEPDKLKKIQALLEVFEV